MDNDQSSFNAGRLVLLEEIWKHEKYISPEPVEEKQEKEKEGESER